MPRGGRRENQGRPKGSQNKSTSEVKQLLDKLSAAMKEGNESGMERTVRRLFEKSHGVTAQRQGRDGEEIIYEVPPDPYAARTLLEMRFGKAKETVEIQDESEKFKGLPQLIIVPPKGWSNKQL